MNTARSTITSHGVPLPASNNALFVSHQVTVEGQSGCVSVVTQAASSGHRGMGLACDLPSSRVETDPSKSDIQDISWSLMNTARSTHTTDTGNLSVLTGSLSHGGRTQQIPEHQWQSV